MAILIPSSSFKTAIIVTGASVLAAAAVKFAALDVAHFAVCYFPIIYENSVLFLRPPYLYLIINCIIVSIVASSRFQKKSSPGGEPAHFPEATSSLIPVPMPSYLTAAYVAGYDETVSIRDDALADQTVEVSRYPEVINEKTVIDSVDDLQKTEKPRRRSDSAEYFTLKAEKPPVSARFGQRKAKKSSSEGGSKTTALGVSKPRRQETLETTWRKITEGRSMPLTRHLKKSDPWEKELGSHDIERTNKSENLEERRSKVETRRRLTREASPGQEELNRRVEAFIKKFNEDMRLQRLESLAKYQTMVNRGNRS